MRKPNHHAHGNPNAGVSYDPSDLRQQRKGNPFTVQYARHNGERCVVHEVYPDQYTCDVFTEQGRFLAGVSFPGGTGNIRAPKRGQLLAVQFELGAPTLYDARVDAEARPGAEAYRVTGVPGFGGEDPIYAGKGPNNQRGDSPKDVMPGDWIQHGDMGQLLAVLDGGTSILKASELAQVIATQAGNLLRLVGKNLSIYTGGGEIDFRSEDGKTTMTLRAGADEATESSPSQDNFRIRAELGDEGELVDFRVTDGKGREVWRCHVDPDGRVQKVARRETAVYDEDVIVEIGTNEVHTVGGERVVEVLGNDTYLSRGERTLQSGGSTFVEAGNDLLAAGRRDTVVASGRNMTLNATGSLASTAPSFQINASNGSAEFNVGFPLYGPAPTGDLTLRNYQADVNITAVAQKVKINSPLPGGVKVGGPGAGLYSAVLYETLKAFMEAFGEALDLHFHVSPFLGLPTGPPVVPPWKLTKALFPLAKSHMVDLGG